MIGKKHIFLLDVHLYLLLIFPHCSLLEGEIPPSPQCAFVVEDDVGVCGYALALTDAKPAAAKIKVR